ncbi:MAG: hypothetical protein CMJ16_00825 [Peredibacter sp.]|nr:hypothetical protein [Peredibacter sp.]
MKSVKFSSVVTTPKLILTLIFVGCLSAFHFETYLTWDASFHLFSILQYKDFFLMINRQSMALFQAPLVAYLHLTELPILGTAKNLYGSIYAFIPFFTLLAGRVMLKSATNAFFLFSISATLPVLYLQLHFLSEHLIACQLYTLMLIALIPQHFSSAYWRLFSLAMAYFIYWLHPVSIFLLGLHGLFILTLEIKYQKKGHLYSLSFLAMALMRLGLMLKTTHSTAQVTTVSPLGSRGLKLLNGIYPNEHIFFLFLILISIFPFIYLRAKKDDKKIYYFLCVSGAIYFFWLFKFHMGIQFALELRHFLFLISTPYYIIFFKSFVIPSEETIERIEGTNKTKYIALLTSIFFTFSLFFTGFDYKQDLSKLDTHIKNENKVCYEGHRLNLQLKNRNWTMWTTFFEYVMYKETRDISIFLAGVNSCNDIKNYKKVLRYVDPNVYDFPYFKISLVDKNADFNKKQENR